MSAKLLNALSLGSTGFLILAAFALNALFPSLPGLVQAIGGLAFGLPSLGRDWVVAGRAVMVVMVFQAYAFLLFRAIGNRRN